MMNRRSSTTNNGGGGGGIISSAPTSGNSITSVSSSNGGSSAASSSYVMAQQPQQHSRTSLQRRRHKRGQHHHVPFFWSFVIKSLLLVVGLLCFLDVSLWLRHVLRPHHHLNHSPLSTTKDDNHGHGSPIMEQEQQQAHRLPPKPVLGDGDDHVPIYIPPQLHHYDDVDADRQPIYEILRQARINPQSLTEEQKQQLPSWSTVRRLYGDGPQIYGLETCPTFRNLTNPSLTFLAMAGTFNSGTNLLASLMIRNCQITARQQVYGEKQRGIRWQVRWGKHTPPEFREQHVTSTDKDVPLQYTLPLITIRDPYNWMQSMCRHPYEVHWDHGPEQCPHVWNDHTHRTSHVVVQYPEVRTHHESLPGLWNDWYNGYMDANYPRIFVRMEDLIFYGKNVTEALCHCGGGSPRRRHFQHIQQSAKLGTAQHGTDKTSLIDAMIRYGTDKDRLEGMTTKDLEVTRNILDPKLMKIFNYSYA